MMLMAPVSTKINKIINARTAKPSRVEAQKILRACGVLDRNNKVKSEYSGIIISEQTKA